MSKEPKYMKIWYDKNKCLEWKGKNLKPSEIALMGAALTEHALNMMDGQCPECGYCIDDCHCKPKHKIYGINIKNRKGR